jgi:hypothetical protein
MWPFTRSQAPAIDPAFGDARARVLLDALTKGDWRAARDVFAAAQDPNALAYLMEAAAEVDGIQEWIGDWIAAEPESTLPVLVRGCSAVAWAWRARGTAGSEYTRQEQFREFFRRLKIAENALDEVIERDPADVTARTWLVTSARGRQVDQQEAQDRFDAVVRRCPHHVVAHEQRLQYLCAKWFGSDEQMFGFARAATAAAPKGSLLPVLVAHAHVEKWLALPTVVDEAHMTNPEVRAELLAAAEQSIFHPDFTPIGNWTRRANFFAMSLHLAGEHSAAARVFDLLGDQPSERPWNYLGRGNNPAARFAKARRDAYARRR